MKKLITIICATVLLVSCNKEDRKENVCPTMQRASIPSSALDHFDSTYVGASSVAWFNVDSKSICAVFDLNNNEYEVIYNNAGGFVSEEIELENEQEGKHEDANDEEGCECDREGEHED